MLSVKFHGAAQRDQRQSRRLGFGQIQPAIPQTRLGIGLAAGQAAVQKQNKNKYTNFHKLRFGVNLQFIEKKSWSLREVSAE
jgi:hypothetical protein